MTVVTRVCCSMISDTHTWYGSMRFGWAGVVVDTAAVGGAGGGTVSVLAGKSGSRFARFLARWTNLSMGPAFRLFPRFFFSVVVLEALGYGGGSPRLGVKKDAARSALDECGPKMRRQSTI